MIDNYVLISEFRIYKDIEKYLPVYTKYISWDTSFENEYNVWKTKYEGQNYKLTWTPITGYKLYKENIMKDEYITVLKWLNKKDYSYMGDALKVVHREHPYIIVENKCKYTDKLRKIVLDTREVETMPLTQRYVESLT